MPSALTSVTPAYLEYNRSAVQYNYNILSPGAQCPDVVAMRECLTHHAWLVPGINIVLLVADVWPHLIGGLQVLPGALTTNCLPLGLDKIVLGVLA